MQYYKAKSAAIILALAFFLSACGGGDDPLVQNELELESAKKALFLYGTSTNDHLAFDTQTQELTELNTYVDDHNETNFKIENKESGWLFVWVDDKGDDNASNDEDKVIMFDANYSYSEDGNATWEDFYYLGHYHEHAHEEETEEEHEDEHEEHLELAAHTNEEFDDDNVSSPKYLAIQRLNSYLQMQDELKETLKNSLQEQEPATEVCNFYAMKHAEDEHVEEGHEEDSYFVLGTNGRLYVFHGHEHDGELELEFKDSALISSAGCTTRESGISPTAEGVLVYLKNTQTLYLVDSHGDARTHVHSSWDIAQLVGEGKSIDMMVGIKTVESEGDAHDHDH